MSYLPDVHTWWPELSIEAKHKLRESSDTTVASEVLSEIEQITGETVSRSSRLSEQQVDFIKTQREAVD